MARALRLVLNDEIEDWQAGERLVQRLVTRPHDVAAVHEFLQRLKSAVVGAGAHLGPGARSRAPCPGTDLAPDSSRWSDPTTDVRA